MTEEMFEGKGGLKLFARSWRPMRTPRGVVVINHGFKSHSGLYAWVADKLVERNLAVYALDMRGHGKSEGERYYVDKFSDYVADLGTFVSIVKQREPGLPVFLARSQRRWCRRVLVRARSPERDRGPHLRELRARSPGARLRARRAEGPQPHRAARARPQAQERGLLARPHVRRDDEERSARSITCPDRRTPSPRWCAPTSASRRSSARSRSRS